MPQWPGSQQDISAFVAQCPEEVHDMATEMVSPFSLSLACNQHMESEYTTVLYRVRVPIILQCQGDGSTLSSNDTAVIWQSYGQLVASRLAILKTAILELSLSVAFIKQVVHEHHDTPWVGPGLLWSYIHSFNEVVFLRITFVCSQWKAWCLQGADKFHLNFCRGHGFRYLVSNDLGQGRVVPLLTSGLRRYRFHVVGSNLFGAWHVGLSVQARHFWW